MDADTLLGVALGTVIGFLTLVPLGETLFAGNSLGLRSPGAWINAAWVTLPFLTVVVLLRTHGVVTSPALAFVPLPLVLIMAMRCTPEWTAVGTASIMGLLAEATTFGAGPFADGLAGAGTAPVAAVYLQAVMLTVTTAVLLLANSRLAAEQRVTVPVRRVDPPSLVGDGPQSQLGAEWLESPVPLAICHVDGSIVSYNRAMRDFLELDADNAVPLHLGSLLPAGVVERFRTMPDLRRWAAAQVYFDVPSGSRWGDVTLTRPTAPSGADLNLVLQVIDVTTTVRSMEELGSREESVAATGLLSRERILASLDRVRASNEHAVMLVDLRAFRVLEFTCEPADVDALLRDVARDIAGTLPTGSHVGHLDTFRVLALLPIGQDADVITTLATTLLQAIGRERNVRGLRIARPASVGILMSPGERTVAEILRIADHALTLAGTAHFHIVDSTAPALSPDDSLHLEHELRQAIQDGAFRPYFQPQVNMESGTVIGFEALARWDHPVRGIVAPAEFLPIMEATGLIVPFGLRMLGTICQTILANPGLLGTISVNASATEVNSRDWHERFLTTIASHGLSADRFAIELTEATLLELSEVAVRSLGALRRAGVALHLDDFGTGYTSVATLQQLPLTAVKLDRSLVDPLVTGDAQAYEIARSVGDLAHALQLETIAEGIETAAHVAALRGTGWTIGQGYHFGAPAAFPQV